jgi:16S rRNA (cytosine967-C5)-methyltransferase
VPEKSVKEGEVQGLASRKLALEVLVAIDKENAYANLALNAAFKRKTLSERDRAFVTALVQGVVRNRMQIDEKLGKLSTRPLDKIATPLKNLLRLAVFQLDQMPDIPPSAVLNVSNELAKKVGHAGQSKFANGVLRSYLRKKEKTTGDQAQSSLQEDEHEDDSIPLSQRLSTKYSAPEWLVKRWLANFQEEETRALLASAQTAPKLTVRTCEMSLTADALEKVFHSNGIKCHRGELVPECLIIDEKPRGLVEKLPGYADGLFSVQDEAAAFVGKVTAPRPGDFVIDLCAAPGGKTLHMAELMQNTGRVLAVDSNASRLNLVKKNRTRLGLQNIELKEADGRTFVSEQQADRVLVDAPCTGTGVMNRRSDLRFNREEVDINQLVEIQRALLSNAACLVKPDGILVYATCSVEPEENFDNIRWFLREFPDFEGDDLSPYLPEKFCQEFTKDWAGPLCKTEPEMTRLYMLQLLPTRHNVSGFFVSRLHRKP